MFCPLIKSKCRDDCVCFYEGECELVNAIKTFDGIDPSSLSEAVEFIAELNNREDVDLYVRVSGAVTAYNE